jgi:hypothetical protein
MQEQDFILTLHPQHSRHLSMLATTWQVMSLWEAYDRRAPPRGCKGELAACYSFLACSRRN